MAAVPLLSLTNMSLKPKLRNLETLRQLAAVTLRLKLLLLFSPTPNSPTMNLFHLCKTRLPNSPRLTLSIRIPIELTKYDHESITISPSPTILALIILALVSSPIHSYKNRSAQNIELPHLPSLCPQNRLLRFWIFPSLGCLTNQEISRHNYFMVEWRQSSNLLSGRG